jgi:hypothetical protein
MVADNAIANGDLKRARAALAELGDATMRSRTDSTKRSQGDAAGHR